jgi:phosphoribosylanthranilate isomerase
MKKIYEVRLLADFILNLDENMSNKIKTIISYLFVYGNTKEEDLISFITQKMQLSIEEAKNLVQTMMLYGLIEKVIHDKLEPKATYIQKASKISRTFLTELHSISIELDAFREAAELQNFKDEDGEGAKLILDQAALISNAKEKSSTKFIDYLKQKADKLYLGITGIVNQKEIKQVIDFFEANDFSVNGTHMPMIGILVSYRTIDLGSNPSNRRYPSLAEIPKLLEIAGNRTFNTIHFNTIRPQVLQEDIARILNLENIYDKGLVHGVQFNIAWPPVEQIDKIKNNYPRLKTILQLSSKAIENLELDEIVERVKAYYFMDYVLIDPSGGKGLNFDITKSVALYKMFKESGIRANIGFAGGLSGENIAGAIMDLRKELGANEFSLDAESNLRVKRSNAYGDDDLDIEKAKKYIEEAAKAFSA